MKIENISVNALIPYARNSRTHSDEQVSQIAASIKEFGWTNPLLVDEERQIIAGHGRLQAAQRMGMGEVPAIVLEGLSDAQKRAYVIADNRLALSAGWDAEMLALEFEDLLADGFDVSLTGFEEAEIDAMLAEASAVDEGLTDDDAVPDLPEEPTSRLGDVWALGRHRLVVGDSTESTALCELLRGSQADMVFTDPPWNVNYGAIKEGNAQGYKVRKILNDHKSDDEWLEFCQGFCGSLFEATKPGAPIYMVMSAQEWPVVDGTLREAGFHWSSTVIWAKDTLVLSRKDYHTQYEPIWYGWNASASRLVNVEDRKQSDVWQIDRPKRSELHPTTKPVELCERAIKNSSNAGDIVLDLFGGSGSTLIAAEKAGRSARLMELDPKYSDVIVKRWEEFTGQKAVLENASETEKEFAVVGEDMPAGSERKIDAVDLPTRRHADNDVGSEMASS
jgi:DNA modification methylase